MSNFFNWSRKIHRWSLWFVIVLGLVQLVTGLTMKYPQLFHFIDEPTARGLHRQTATYFAVFFGIQMLTGIIMYITPWLLKITRKSSSPV